MPHFRQFSLGMISWLGPEPGAHPTRLFDGVGLLAARRKEIEGIVRARGEPHC
jgi:hypothetical protein